MVGILVLSFCFFTPAAILAQSNTTSNLKSGDGLQKTNTVQKTWRMPLSMNHPIRKELERDPGVLIGRLEDFDLAKLRRGEFSPLKKAQQQKTGRPRSPLDIFFRKRRESKPSTCSIEIQMNHPIRKELERDPGVLIGRLEDFDLAKLRRGEFSPLKKAQQQKTGRPRSPLDIFFRKRRESKPSTCSIEIQMIVSRAGHCIKLRDNTPACQSDEYVALDHDDCS